MNIKEAVTLTFVINNLDDVKFRSIIKKIKKYIDIIDKK